MITIILTTIVVVVTITSAKFVMSRYFEEWREMDVDNIEKK